MVEVSINGGTHMTNSGLVYEYRTGSVVAAIEPSMGPVAGGTAVRVTGEGLLSNAQAVCRFGSSELRLGEQPSSSTMMWCTSPARQSEGRALVEVSVDGLAFSADGHRFLYYTAEEVHHVMPSVGSAGHAHLVRVTGKHFLDTHVAVSYTHLTLPTICSV